MLSLLQDPFIAGLLASVVCGIIGTYVVVGRIVFISGGISHTAYGGVGLGYLAGFNPLLGATGFSVLAALGIGLANRRLKAGADTVIGIIWALGMALGILFVRMKPGSPPDLMSFLFGDILFVTTEDLYLILVLDFIVVVTVILFYKEFQAIAFDEEFATVLGVPVERLYLLLLVLIALTVVILIRVVGIILVIALLTLPCATARLFAERLGRMMVLSSVIGAVCTTCGLLLSYSLNLPSGPLIIIVAVVVYILAIASRRVFSSRIVTD